MTEDAAGLMLRHVISAAQEALATPDPAKRAQIIAGIVQPYSGWALRWAVEDCRARRITWTEIAQLLDRPYSTVLRQVQARGPVYAHQPAHSAGTRNFDGQTPLRRAATQLVYRMIGLAMTRPDSITAFFLRDRVDQLASAQGTTDTPEPLLQATRVVLAGFGEVRSQMPGGPGDTEEKAVWSALEELEICYQRDRAEIETAHRVRTEPWMQPGGGTVG